MDIIFLLRIEFLVGKKYHSNRGLYYGEGITWISKVYKAINSQSCHLGPIFSRLYSLLGHFVYAGLTVDAWMIRGWDMGIWITGAGWYIQSQCCNVYFGINYMSCSLMGIYSGNYCYPLLDGRDYCICILYEHLLFLSDFIFQVLSLGSFRQVPAML